MCFLLVGGSPVRPGFLGEEVCTHAVFYRPCLFMLGLPQGAGLCKPGLFKRRRWSPFGPRCVLRRAVHGQRGAISGYMERVNERFGWVNSSDKRRPLALSGERTYWPLVSPWGTGVAKGKSCLGSDS